MAIQELAQRYEATATLQIGRKTVQKGDLVLLTPSQAAPYLTAKKLAEAELAPHKVLRNLRHDGKGYAPGATVNLHSSDAAPLLKAKVVEAAPAKVVEAAPAKAEEPKAGKGK